MSNRVPSTLAVLAGGALYDEVKNLGREIHRRGRKRLADYLLGRPSYRNSFNRKSYDRSLMRLRNVRRASTKRRIATRYGRRVRRRATRYVRRRSYSRGRARRAMGTNGPAFRTKLRFSKYRMQLGERIGFMPSRRHQSGASISTHVDKTLHAVPLVKIPYSDTDDVMNSRQGRLVDVTGVKWRCWISLKNNLIESSKIWDTPIQVRWALINPRENTGETTDVTTGTNFFVSDSPGADDATDFPAAENCFRYMNRKINTRRYGVLQEGSFLLSNDPSSTTTRVTPRSRKFLTLYVPIKRQMKWGDNSTATYPNANIFFVYWFVAQGDKGTAKVYAADPPFDFTYEHVTYFRNPEVLG
ncbi:capsid protein [Mute swan feces associated circular virus 13]|nr:capsid protein [Mute swan feces associated circular virus 13]